METEYLTMDNFHLLTRLEMLVVKARLGTGVWKHFRMCYILCDNRPITFDSLRELVTKFS